MQLGMSTTTETLCGQAFGARQHHMMGVYLQRSWIVNLVTASILLPILIFATPIYKLIGQQSDISEASKNISLWFISYTYTLAFSLTTNIYLQAQMKNMINVWLSSGSMLVHVFLSWIFVYRLNLGISGAMGSMIISQWGLVFSDWVYIFGGRCKETWKGFSTLSFVDLVPLIKLSISSGFMICLEFCYSSILVLIAGYSNNVVVGLSAFSICLNLNAWEFMVALGLLAATSVRISNQLGRGDVGAAKFSLKVILCMAAFLGLFFCLLCIIFGHAYPYLFTSDVEVAKAASGLSTLLALTMLLSGFKAVFAGLAIGCGSQFKVAIVNAISYYVIGIPIGGLLTFLAKLGIKKKPYWYSWI
ncbi:uncharacterized protein [Phyllobates terribilis]|uniref:uncharacterized protein n=1 Tax=Phyllobates terribilis TaxID=111132 RepID=UPI003CCB65A8